MADYTITNVSIIEDADFTFYLSFLYGEKILNTVSMPRTSSEEQVKSNIAEAIRIFEGGRADDNFKAIKETFGKELVTIKV